MAWRTLVEHIFGSGRELLRAPHRNAADLAHPVDELPAVLSSYNTGVEWPGGPDATDELNHIAEMAS